MIPSRPKRSEEGDDELPILEWEDPERRVRLPRSLQQRLGLPVATLRWSREKYAQVVIKHAVDLPVLLELEVCLEARSYAGRQHGRDDGWTVLFEYGSKTYFVSIGRDHAGSYNMVTAYGSNDPGYIDRRKGQLKGRDDEG